MELIGFLILENGTKPGKHETCHGVIILSLEAVVKIGEGFTKFGMYTR